MTGEEGGLNRTAERRAATASGYPLLVVMTPPPRRAFPLRLDPALFNAVERAAASDLRSVNAQMQCLLREALLRRGVRLGPPERARRGRPRKEESDA